MKNRGYKIEYKHDLKYYLKFAGCIIGIILIFIVIYQIPIIKKIFNRLYEENIVIQTFVNIIKQFF